MVNTRLFHTATRLLDGRVLVAGTRTPKSSNDSAELYDPVGNAWHATASMKVFRSSTTATLLSDGKVLVAAGFDISKLGLAAYLYSAEVYDPAADQWTFTGSLSVARSLHEAAALTTGKVLVTGGTGGNPLGPIASSELYDPATKLWSPTGSMTTTRSQFALTELADGRVLAVGGVGPDRFAGPLSSAELYDPAAGTWTATGSLSVGRINIQVRTSNLDAPGR